MCQVHSSSRRNHRRGALLHPATGVVQLSPGHRTAHATVPPGTVRPEHVGQAVPFMFDSPLDLPRDISTTQSSNTLGSMEQPPQPIQPSVSDPDAHTASARLTRSHSRTSFDSLLFYLFSPTPSQEPPPPGTTDWDIQGEFDSCQDLSVHAHDKLPTTDLPSNEEDLLESAEHATQEVVAGVSITSNTYGSGRIPEWWTTPLARSSDAARMKDLCQKGPLYHARPSSTSTARLPTLVHPSPRLLISLLGSIGVIGTAASEEDEATTWNTPFPAALDHMLKIVGGDGKEKFGPDVMSNEARDDWEELKWKADREYDERLHSKYALSLSEQAQEDSADVMEMDSDSDSVIAEPVSEWEELKRVIDRESEPRFMWDTDGTEKHLRGITLESILEYERSVIPASGGDRDKSRIEVLLAEDSPSAVGREKNVADAGIVVTAPIGLGIITRTSSHANLLKYHAGDIVGLRSSLSTASI
ncbi:hypothetical protein FRB96_009185 [Tulasnella sp. 330]|nr:hypothetical protein FRB96_009185 [Tulasnella sp. 330]KAG8880902.1 hypothetical protein FRB97_000346 [Tulasnella sp. 331]